MSLSTSLTKLLVCIVLICLVSAGLAKENTLKRIEDGYSSLKLLTDVLLALGPQSIPQHAARRIVTPNRADVHMDVAFKTPKSTDKAAADQAERVAAEGLSPKEYEETTRRRANEYLATNGAHVGAVAKDGPVQQAGFTKQLWDVDSIPAVPADVAQDSSRVLATVYEIGGPLTNVLSTSVAKKLPLIPHIGIRVHGVEYFYSDHIEYRSVPVMEEMLGDRPSVTLDLGPSTKSPEEVKEIVKSLEADWTADDYHVFDKNCVHFSEVLAKRLSIDGMPQPLLQGVVDVSERMLDSLPEWRRALGRRVMNEVTRLVVVSWGRASKEKKEATAEKLGLEKGS